MNNYETQWLEFQVRKFAKKKKKTDEWTVYHKIPDEKGKPSDDAEVIGVIKWESGWRRYCFFPLADTHFDSLCLDEIRKHIDELMRERKYGVRT